MDLFEKACVDIGIDPSHFGHDNMFSFIIEKDNENNFPILVTLFRSYEDMTLCVTMTSSQDLPSSIHFDFILALCEQAMEPARNGIGIGTLKNDSRLSVFKRIPVEDRETGYFKNCFAEILACAEYWDDKVSKLRQGFSFK